MAIKKINDTCLTSIAAAIREKNGTTETYKPSEMAAAISAIETGGGGVPEEAFKITGDCSYRFTRGGWDWFIREFGKRVKTENITNMEYMFQYSTEAEIPFELNASASSNCSVTNMFYLCSKLISIPKISNCKASTTNNMFGSCWMLRELPEDLENYFDWSYLDNLTSEYSGARNSMFTECRSLRSIPMGFLNHGNPKASYYYAVHNNGFYMCNALDEILGLPIPSREVAYTSNSFASSFNGCYRLKNMTFKCPDGAPYVVKWKNQVIDLASIGVVLNVSQILHYNSGITADKEVKDDATYQALKNDKDWYSTMSEYSRYNHDSAVETINSLPDASAYLATAGGTNTIKFKGAAGSATDGGAINTLTQEEIAVATAKGWTVTLV